MGPHHGSRRFNSWTLIFPRRGDREQRESRSGMSRRSYLSSIPGSFLGSTRWPANDSRLKRVRWNHANAVPGLNSLPRVAEEQSETSVSDHRSQCDLSAHRGDLHAFHAWRTARRLGLDSIRRRVGSGGSRSHVEGLAWYPEPSAVDLTVRWHGMVRADRDSTPLVSRAGGGLAMAHRGGPGVHGRHRVLCGGPSALRPFRLAHVRPGGDGVSLLCGAVVRRLTAIRAAANGER